MRRIALAVALACAFAAAPAAAGTSMCEVRSDYSVRIGDDGVTFHRDSGTPKVVQLAGGRLQVDGREQALSDDDRAKLRRIEAGVRELVPAVREIGIEAAQIAADAVLQVAIAFSADDAEAARARAERLRDDLSARIEAAVANGDWDSSRFEKDVEAMVADVTAGLAGDIAAVAVKAALSGDQAAVADIERRASELEATMEREIKARAKRIEARAEAICPQVEAIAALQAELRYADGQPLELMQRR